jgi:hypothetical protein
VLYRCDAQAQYFLRLKVLFPKIQNMYAICTVNSNKSSYLQIRFYEVLRTCLLKFEIIRILTKIFFLIMMHHASLIMMLAK